MVRIVHPDNNPRGPAMDTPTPTPTPIDRTPETDERASRPSRRRTATVTGLAAAVAAAGLGVAGFAHADGTDEPVRTERAAEARENEDNFGDTTLDELADELAELGLELRVSPVGGAGDGLDDGQADGDRTEPADDPFAGMTDEEIDALSDDEFFALLDEAGWTIDDDGWIVPEGDTGTHDPADHDHDPDSFDEAAATFTVDGDSITPARGDADAISEGETLWQRFVELIPADQREMLVGFEVMAERGAGGYVYPDENDPTKWHMGIAPGLGADEDWVLIHEFAHLLTLQAKEVPPSFDDGSCPTYHTGEGCSLKSSTMNEFVERFWPQEQIDTIFAAQENEDYDALDRFYEENQDAFVTDYATTNPAEDLAETFTVFVLNDRPTGDTIADQKIEFLWNDADMVELRAKIRAAL
ncbi:MAG: putative zinc-binding metallopeptidase [Actinomycetota bacterium]